MYSINAILIARTIQVRALRPSFQGTLLFQDSDEVFFRIGTYKFVYFFQFGVVGFFNLDENERRAIIKSLSPFIKEQQEGSHSETIEVSVKDATLKVDFDGVILPTLDEEMVRLVMLHTVQSVALEVYESHSEKLLEEAGKYTKNLELNGKLWIGSKKLKQLIGKTLNIKNAISENLYIFDSPEVVWQDEQLSKLDADLKQLFDLKIRYRNITERISTIKDNLDLFRDIWNHRESSALEWIIILLIFVEIVDLFVGKIF